MAFEFSQLYKLFSLYTAEFYFYNIFERINFRNARQISGSRGLRGGVPEGGGYGYKLRWWIYQLKQVKKLYRTLNIHTTHTVQVKLGQSKLRFLNSVHANILLVVLYYSFATCYHWGKLGKVYRDCCILFLATVCESTIVSIKFQLKKRWWMGKHSVFKFVCML